MNAADSRLDEGQHESFLRLTASSKVAHLLGLNVLIAGAYWALAVLVKWYFSHYQMWPAPLWAPAGLALFAVLAIGRRSWPGIFVGSLATNIFSFDAPWLWALIVSGGNTIGPIVAVRLVGDRLRLDALFGHVKDVYYFGLCSFLSGMMSALVATGAIALSNPTPTNVLVNKWFEWLFSDAAAALLLTPLFLLWRFQPPSQAQINTRTAEFVTSTVLAILAVLYLLFGTAGERAVDAGASFLILLPILWMAVRLSLNLAYPMFLAVMAATIAGTLAGFGPFAGVQHGGTLVIFAQMSIGFGASVLLIGGAANEQRATQESLQKLNLELETRVQLRTAALQATQKRLEKAALYDSLTGLPNRRLLEERFSLWGVGGRRRDDRLALLLIDLDHFKQINDNFGHDAGDALLIETGCRLVTSVRDTDTVARMGGDEFAIVLWQADEREIIDAICRRILKAMSVTMSFHGQELKTGASIGVALFAEHGFTWHQLYKAADLALYDSKHSGRNAFRWRGAEVGVRE